MSNELEKKLGDLDLDNLNVLQVSKILDDKFEFSEISRSMAIIHRNKTHFPPNVFGNCGIDPEIDPCGDACEY